MDTLIFFLKEGLFHVLDWNAYDHILFLVALAVVYDFKNWKKLIWLITLFTLGHTLSLILAAYQIVSVDTKWIEFLIMMSTFVYLWLSMKYFYEQGYFITIIKSSIASFIYMLLILPFAVGIIIATSFFLY